MLWVDRVDLGKYKVAAGTFGGPIGLLSSQFSSFAVLLTPHQLQNLYIVFIFIKTASRHLVNFFVVALDVMFITNFSCCSHNKR